MRNKINSILLILFCSILFSACKSDNPVESSTGTIKVKVLYVSNNTPIPVVLINTNPATESLLTDSTGELTLNAITPGSYKITASKSNYITNSVDVNVISGKISTAIILLSDSKSNNKAPEAPQLIEPINSSIVSNSVTFKWTCKDPENDKLTYDVICDENANPTKTIASNLTNTTFAFSNLEHNKTYYWKIIAKDTYGLSSESQINSFKFDTTKISIPAENILLNMPFNNKYSYSSPFNLTVYPINTAFTSDRNGLVNGAVLFNGTSSIEISDNGKLNLPSEFTISLWTKPTIQYTSSESICHYLIGKWNGTGINQSSYVIVVYTNGKINAVTYDTYQNSFCPSSSEFLINKWVHICYTYKNNIGSIYINGKLENQLHVGTPQKSDYSLFLGAQNDGNAGYSGAIDDLYIFNKALTQAEITELAK